MSRFAAAAALLAAVLTLPGHAVASSFETGFADRLYQDPDPAQRGAAYERTVEAGAGIVRLNVVWREVADSEPADPRNPADPAYDFASLDAAVRDASQRGLEVMFTIYSAPDWAEGPNRSGDAAAGTWRPQPAAFGDFATAIASRYSGGFLGLPRVRYYQAWNEPNLPVYLTPAYDGQVARSPSHYRSMLNAFFEGVKGVRGDNRVVTAGTGPYGDPPGGGPRVRPLSFWRDVLCLEGRRDLQPIACPEKASFDILAHHPINTSGGPKQSAVHPDDASTPDFDQVRKVLRAAERGRTTGTSDRHQLWATEIWWDSNPPDDVEGVPLARHARWMQEALHVLWQQGARVVIALQLRDEPFDPGNAYAENSSGVLFADGTKKPAFTAFRFPFVVERAAKRLAAWGVAPSGGRLVIERKAAGWRKVKSVNVKAGKVFRTKLDLRGRQKLRARIGDDASLVWAQR